MPFRPELNYFFLYLKKYLEEKYKIRVERGDSNVLTKELMKKISDQISTASFLIADITGSNANVYYELGGHVDFLAKLDNAVRNVLGSSLDVTQMYETARDLLKQFNLDSGFTH